ncbi:MAG: hypothetical protein LKF52_03300 [Butyrivibrio sp.]|nr:hypothetical protein [Butyrivibrio sp.]
MKKNILFLLLTVILLTASCSPASVTSPSSDLTSASASSALSSEENGNMAFSLGTADTPDGTTLILPVLASDANTSWNLQQPRDQDTLENALTYLGIACNWLSSQSRKWGYQADFIYDWTTYPDLMHTGTFNTDLVNYNDNMDTSVWNYIDQHVDTKALMQKYHADNIIYMLLINTPSDNNVTSCTRNWYAGMEYPYEVCYMYLHCDGYEESPAAYAHEILHTFGAVDLYTADPEFHITDHFINDYVKKEDANDIMYTCYNEATGDSEYHLISNKLTALDAYYIGWTDASDVVSAWHLTPSEHLPGSAALSSDTEVSQAEP